MQKENTGRMYHLTCSLMRIRKEIGMILDLDSISKAESRMRERKSIQ